MPAASQPSVAPWELSRWCFGEQCPREMAAERVLAQPCLLFLPAGDGGAFADRRGRGGCGFPPSLHPLPWSYSCPGVASPGTGSGTGSGAVPGRWLISRGQGAVSNEGAALCHSAQGCTRVPVAPGVTGLPVQAGTQGAMPGWHLLLSLLLSSSAVPPPPPPSATGTVGANVPPASGKDTFSPCPSTGDISPSSVRAAPGERLSPPRSLHPLDPGGGPCASSRSPFLSAEYYDVEERL